MAGVSNGAAGREVLPGRRLRLALLINPLAGIGGPAGLKGSDDIGELVDVATATLRAPARALRCLTLLQPLAAQLDIITWGGPMGETLLAELGLAAQVAGYPAQPGCTSAEDTRQACRAFLACAPDLLLFVGGDGTARNICEVVGEHLPVLGIPSGVKMQSGVFALLPEAAAAVIGLLLQAGLVDVRLQEVRDIDEAAYRRGEVRSRCFGELLVPEVGQFVQVTKQGGLEVEALVLDDIAAEVASRMADDTLYLIGPGTTPRALMEHLGLPNTLLGIDVIRAGQVLAADLSGPQLEHLLAQESGPVVAILTATGGQGSLLGRGNQQLTPAVLRRIGREQIWIIATKSKIQALGGRPLLIDTNDPELDRQLTGFYRVITGYQDEILYPASGLPTGPC